MPVPEIELLTNFVSRIFRVEDVTVGEPKEWIVRYRGHLLSEDTVAAYDQLAESLRSYNITPLFRKEPGDNQVIFLVSSPTIPKFGSRIYVNIILFIITVFSVMLTGVNVPPEAIPANTALPISYLFRYTLTGWPFALSMMGILFAHEMGHYVMCRYYKIPATLPYFLPAPLISPLGTFGAFIMMRGIPKNKRLLFDVGIAGPIAGLVIAIPVLFI
ncbi:MAG TPA: site-2 protease family protein, partial [Anaerolineales bacterium]